MFIIDIKASSVLSMVWHSMGLHTMFLVGIDINNKKEVTGLCKSLINPLLPKLTYETTKITQEIIFYGLSDLCVICEEPHPLINTENYIPYESSILLLTKHLNYIFTITSKY